MHSRESFVHVKRERAILLLPIYPVGARKQSEMVSCYACAADLTPLCVLYCDVRAYAPLLQCMR